MIGLIVLCFLAGIVASVRYFADPDRKLVRNRDAEVIETALLEFYPKRDWQPVDWRVGKFVAVRTEYVEDKRPSFFSSLDIALSESDSPEVERLKALYPKQREVALAPALLPGKLLVDDRIVIDSKTRGFYGDPPLFSRHGKQGAARVFSYLWMPTYSPDGRIAIVRLTAPRGIHGSDVTFVLRLESGRWKVIDATAMHYR